jgi:hypothetical protein
MEEHHFHSSGENGWQAVLILWIDHSVLLPYLGCCDGVRKEACLMASWKYLLWNVCLTPSCGRYSFVFKLLYL